MSIRKTGLEVGGNRGRPTGQGVGGGEKHAAGLKKPGQFTGADRLGGFRWQGAEVLRKWRAAEAAEESNGSKRKGQNQNFRKKQKKCHREQGGARKDPRYDWGVRGNKNV